MKNQILFVASFCFLLSNISAQEVFYTNQNIPRDTSFTAYGTYLKTVKYYPDVKIALPVLPKGVVEHRDMVYAVLNDSVNKNRKMYLDVFHPEKEGKYPALIMVHGGGWKSGDKSLQIPLAMEIASHGYITITVEYQLSREASYPNAVYNIKSAIRWIRANAEKYEIDTAKIAISGCSAGGQIACLTGLTNGVTQFEGDHGNTGFSSKIQAIIDIDGALDFMAPLSLNLQRRPNSPDVEWLGGNFYEKPAIWREASPIFWLNRNSPPVLFINSGFPRFSAGQYEMLGMMNNWGIYSEVHKFNVKVHPFWLLHPWFQPTVNHIVNFMNKVFFKCI